MTPKKNPEKNEHIKQKNNFINNRGKYLKTVDKYYSLSFNKKDARKLKWTNITNIQISSEKEEKFRIEKNQKMSKYPSNKFFLIKS